MPKGPSKLRHPPFPVQAEQSPQASVSLISSSTLPWAALYMPVHRSHGERGGKWQSWQSREIWACPIFLRANAVLSRPSTAGSVCSTEPGACCSPRHSPARGISQDTLKQRGKHQLGGRCRGHPVGCWGWPSCRHSSFRLFPKKFRRKNT